MVIRQPRPSMMKGPANEVGDQFSLKRMVFTKNKESSRSVDFYTAAFIGQPATANCQAKHNGLIKTEQFGSLKNNFISSTQQKRLDPCICFD